MAYDFPSAPVLDQTYTTPNGVSYVWNGYGWQAGSGGSAGAGDYVLKAGDTMTGALILSEHPTAVSAALQAATKQYVDDLIAALMSGQPGQALTTAPTGMPEWGAPIDAANY